MIRIGKLNKGENKNLGSLSTDQTLGWQIDKYKFPEIWAKTKGEGVKVAILDTAIDLSHPDIKIHGGYDFVNNQSLDYYKVNFPVQGHGTHVAGIIGAKDNEQGIVGVAPECKMYSCVVLGDDGSGSYEGIINAIDWCIENKMDVINMSLGGGADYEGFYKAIRRAYDAGIPTICAGGNSDWDTGYLDFPGTYNETIAVASITSQMKRSSFSSIGSNIDVAAPGSDILSCVPDNSYAVYSGTSMASPFVAGLVALMISKHRKEESNTPIDNVEDVREHLIKTAKDVDEIGQDNYTGYGLINPLASVSYNTTDNQMIITFSDLINGKLKVKANKFIKRRWKGNIKKGKIVTYKPKKWMVRCCLK